MSKKITTTSPTGEPDEPRRGQKSLAASIAPYVWLTPQQMEDRYGMSKSYWYNHRRDGTGPPFNPMGARTILYRLDLVEAWFAAREVKGFDDAKYREIEAIRKAKKAKRIAAKAPKARAMPHLSTFSQLRLGQLRMGAPASGITRVDRHAQSGTKPGLQTGSRFAQSVVETLCPKLICCPSGSSRLFTREIRLPA